MFPGVGDRGVYGSTPASGGQAAASSEDGEGFWEATCNHWEYTTPPQPIPPPVVADKKLSCVLNISDTVSVVDEFQPQDFVSFLLAFTTVPFLF